ncbi:MAG: hypothetical protein OXG47_05535 [bacterium]|nr:hypothetical protein [bacterium]
MTWPGWGEVLPLVVGAVTLFAVLVGGMRALTRTVAEQAAAAAREAAKEATDSLYEKLRTNDFRHVEERIERVDVRMQEDVKAMEARIGERLDRARQDRRDMEARILAAVERRPAADSPEAREVAG